MKALELRVGKQAAAKLASEGWHADLFDGLIGASGGPKWLILGQMDRVLSTELLASRTRALPAIGSSVGSWRHALMAQPDPVAAIDRFEAAYLSQSYSSAKPKVPEITRVASWLLRSGLGEEGDRYVANHPWLQSQVVTARGLGLAKQAQGPGLVSGMALAGLGNTVSRRSLGLSFRRTVFTHEAAESPDALFADFQTEYVLLTDHNVFNALMASGAIPYVFEAVTEIEGSSTGAHWDGGILDYHFDLARLPSDQIWLYPHFSKRVTVGWFDKFLPWRADRVPAASGMVMLCPTDEFLASLPFGKIPDRRDFGKMPEAERVAYWKRCVAESQRLADELHQLLTGSDPLANAIIVE